MRAFVFFSRKLKGETENNCADLLILIYSAKTFKDSLEKFIVNGILEYISILLCYHLKIRKSVTFKLTLALK